MLLLWMGVVVTLSAWTSAEAKVFLTLDEALKLAFPGCEIERQTIYLTAAQLERARGLAGVKIDGAIVYPYVASRNGEWVGTAYFDAHRVRTLPELLMIVVSPQGRVERLEILSFTEPEDYIPGNAWYEQFLGRELDQELRLKRSIRGVTGATLTARATTEAVRRVLAIHQVLQEVEEP